MDNIEFLYNLTLKNYILDEEINNDITFKNLLESFISKNRIIFNSKEIIYKFFIYLHYELDQFFYKFPKNDIANLVKYEYKSRLRINTRRLASKIYKHYTNTSDLPN
jgi:hypothetical protein